MAASVWPLVVSGLVKWGLVLIKVINTWQVVYLEEALLFHILEFSFHHPLF
jgi:hypothetical protein